MKTLNKVFCDGGIRGGRGGCVGKMVFEKCLIKLPTFQNSILT